jgi:hypothetical protein
VQYLSREVLGNAPRIAPLIRHDYDALLGRHHAGDGVAHEARLLVALDLEGEAGDDLPPAAALLVDRDDLGATADAGVDRDGGWEADLVVVV